MVFKKKITAQKQDELGQLAALAQSGDLKAYNQLLMLSVPYIRTVLHGSISDLDSIEDITQEVLISIHKALKTYSPDRKFKPWLYSIIQFRRTDYLRKYYSKKGNKMVDLDHTEFIENFLNDPLFEKKVYKIQLEKDTLDNTVYNMKNVLYDIYLNINDDTLNFRYFEQCYSNYKSINDK